jgi:outer membrane protein assembly factor BamB
MVAEDIDGAGDTVYVGTAGAMQPTFECVHALDAEDGSERWRFECDDTGFGPPAIADGSLYVIGGDGPYARGPA